MKNIYTLGNTCKPNQYCLEYLGNYAVKTVFAGIIHNQLLMPYAIPYYLFDFEIYNDIFNIQNWIVCKSICVNSKLKDSLRNHLYVDKSQSTKSLCRLYYQCDNSIRDLLQQDISQESFDFNLNETETNKTNTIFYNKKYNCVYPHGDSRTSLETYISDMQKRYDEFKKMSHYFFYIYRLDPFIKYKQLLHFENFLKNHHYNFNNFIYLDTDNHGFLPTEIKTVQCRDDTKLFFAQQRDFLIQKSVDLENKYMRRNIL